MLQVGLPSAHYRGGFPEHELKVLLGGLLEDEVTVRGRKAAEGRQRIMAYHISRKWLWREHRSLDKIGGT
jgi:hypothetical protein